RDALGDRDDQSDAGVGRLEDRVGGEARRDEDHRGVGAGLVDRLGDRVEDGDPVDVLAALAGRHAGDDLRAVALVVGRVDGALATGDVGDDQAGLSVDEDAHAIAPWLAASSTTFSAASFIVAAVATPGRLASASSLRPSTSLVPSRRTTNGTVGLMIP